MYSIDNVHAVLQENSFNIFSRPYELNIVGIRANSTIPNNFDDTIFVSYTKENGAWQSHQFRATTDPGTYWLLNPLDPNGTAILKHGQYLRSYKIGLHRGLYPALVQENPVTVIRDYQRKAVLDFMNGWQETGMFGINIHHAADYGTTKYIDKYSAGCQVFANAGDFAFFMQLCERHRSLYGNQFTYTLIDERALIRSTKKNWCSEWASSAPASLPSSC